MQTGELYWSKVEPYWDVVSIYDGAIVFTEQFRQLPVAVGHLFAAHWCQSEIRNGGFSQFFLNPTGVLAPEAAAGFRAIGLPELADVLERAMSYFSQPYPREQEPRWAVLRVESQDDWPEPDPFEELDEQFFSLVERFDEAADVYASSIQG